MLWSRKGGNWTGAPGFCGCMLNDTGARIGAGAGAGASAGADAAVGAIDCGAGALGVTAGFGFSTTGAGAGTTDATFCGAAGVSTSVSVDSPSSPVSSWSCWIDD